MHLVPFSAKWTGSETKLDLKAIYRRPGSPGITLTSPLPLRRHSDWDRKGFEFVSLATLEDLALVAGDLRREGIDPNPMRDCFDAMGVFRTDEYLREAGARDADKLADLRAKVEKFGPDAVTEMMRHTDPTFELPEALAKIKGPKAAKAPGGADDK